MPDTVLNLAKQYRKTTWLLVIVVVYTLLGFFVVPPVLKSILPDLVRDNLQRDSTVAEVRFNPWILELELSDLRIADDQGGELASVDRLVVNLETLSLVRLALVFHAVTVDTLELNIVRYAFDDSNWGRVLADIDAAAAAAPAEPEPAEDDGGLQFRVGTLAIANTAINIRDEARDEAFATRISPIDITVNDLSTLPDEDGNQEVRLLTENEVEVTWSGSVDLAPFSSAGSLELNGSPIPVAYRYFENDLNFGIDNCCFRIGFNYDVEALEDGVRATVDSFGLLISNVVVSGKGDEGELINVPALEVSGGTLAYPEQAVSVELVSLRQPALRVWLNADGSVNLTRLIAAEEESYPGLVAAEEDIEAAFTPDIEAELEPDGSVEAEAEEAAWDFSVDRVEVVEMRVAFADRSLDPYGEILLDPINAAITGFSNRPEDTFSVDFELGLPENGQVRLTGDAGIVPEVEGSFDFNATDLWLPLLQPWLGDVAAARLDSGRVGIALNVETGPAETLLIKGDASVAGLKVRDLNKDTELAGWDDLQLSQIRFQLDAAEAELSRVLLVKPYGRLAIAEDGTTNFQDLAKGEPAETPRQEPDGSAESDPLRVRVGTTEVRDGALDFSDRSLQLPFRVLISEFNGQISTIDSASSQPSKLDFTGKVGDYGLTTINGQTAIIDPVSNTAVGVNFRNISMPDMSPYTVEFAGRRIKSGKLNLDLDYTLEDNRVIGSNEILLTDFELGEKVPSEDAMSLPLDLGVALLRDANGDIDLALKVSGDLDDPNFSASGIILKAFANIITKAVASPFKLFSGGDDELQLDAIAFRPGTADLTPPEREKLDVLSAELGKRPALALRVDGGIVREIDLVAMRSINVDAQLQTILGADNQYSEEQLIKRTRKAYEKMAKAQLPELSLRKHRKNFRLTDPATGKSEFDEVAYSADLRNRLETVQPIGQAEVDGLAMQRRDMILAYLQSRNEIPAARLVAGTTAEATVNDVGWIDIPLAVEVAATPAPAADAAAAAR